MGIGTVPRCILREIFGAIEALFRHQYTIDRFSSGPMQRANRYHKILLPLNFYWWSTLDAKLEVNPAFFLVLGCPCEIGQDCGLEARTIFSGVRSRSLQVSFDILDANAAPLSSIVAILPDPQSLPPLR